MRATPLSRFGRTAMRAYMSAAFSDGRQCFSPCLLYFTCTNFKRKKIKKATATQNEGFMDECLTN